jgi:O-antigen ligase
LIKALGRDMTFTGRANIWAEVTPATVNPIVGAGYWNFWGGPGGFKISQAMQTVVPNAHCGYVDIYLDGGIIGLILLFLVLVTSGVRIIGYLGSHRDETRYFRVRLAFLVVAIIYNLAESTFARMGAIWFTTLLMIMSYSPLKLAVGNAREAVRQRVSSRSTYHSHAVVN